jgi:anaerobic selenocysteine-containing dehydrogenase
MEVKMSETAVTVTAEEAVPTGPPPMRAQDTPFTGPWQWEEDGLTVSRTTAWSAPGCHEGCGIYLYTDKEGRVVRVEGDPEDPFNRGRLCPRCFCIDEVMYHKQRILHPMKRDKAKRGDNDAWEQCSWDEALDICEREFRAIAEKYGAETIHFQRGTERDASWQTGRLAYAIGSPNEYGSLSGIACYIPRMALMIMTMGGAMIPDFGASHVRRYDDPAYEIPNCTLVWGCNPLNSNPDFQMGHWLTDVMKKGTRVITVDPRVTWIAAQSDLHLPIRPGSDGALALGMLNVLIAEDLYDHDFVDKWTYGFEELKEVVKEWTPEKVAAICWVSADKIKAATRLFAEKKPSNVYWGLAVDMQNSGTGAAAAIVALWVLTGNVDIPGGMIFTLPPFWITTFWGGWGLYDLPQEVQEKRCGLAEYPMYRYGFTFASPDKSLEAGLAGKIKGLWIQGTNPLTGMSQEVEKWTKVMTEAEFCAVADIFMTPTATVCADVFLPVKCWPEKKSVRMIHYNIATVNDVAAPAGDVKSDGEISLLLGRRFSEEFWPWQDEEEIYDEILAPSGYSYQALRENGPAYPEFHYRKHEKGLLRKDGQPGFETPTGRIEIFSTLLQQFGLEPLPYFGEPMHSPFSTPEMYRDYPIILMTGSRSPVFFHTEHRQIDRLRQFNPDPQVEMNPEDAKELNIHDGDWVWLENTRGRCRQRAAVSNATPKGMALGQHGWWYPEMESSEPVLNGMRDININYLLENAPGACGFGADVKCVLCRIYKVKEGEM